MLDHIDPRSLTWRTLMEWVENEITIHQAALEEPGCKPFTDDVLRGRIKQLREIIALGVPAKGPRLVPAPSPTAR